MINLNDPNLYQASCNELVDFRRLVGPRLRGRFVQLFLALKFYQGDMPSMFSNQFVSTEVVQTLLDDLYAKASRPLNECVLMLFENSYHARTGLTGPGNTTPKTHGGIIYIYKKGLHATLLLKSYPAKHF